MFRSPFLVKENAELALHSLFALKALDANSRLDPHLYSMIVENILFIESIHTPYSMCKEGNLPVVRYLFEEYLTESALAKVSIDQCCYSAIRNGHEKIVLYLYKRFPNLEFNPRFIAVYDYAEVMKYILEHRTVEKERIYDALRVLTIGKNTNMIRYLVEYLVEHGDDSDRNRLLIEYSKYGDLELIKYLVRTNTCFDQLLIVACRNGRLEIVKYLVEKGADIHIDKEKPLVWACKNGHLEVVKYLAEKGADLHVHNEMPLIYSCLSMVRGQDLVGDRYLKIIEFLVQNGANLHVDDETPLILASSYGQLELVKYFVENGADLHADNGKALYVAVINSYINVVKYLVEQGADIHRNNEEVVCKAAKYGHLEVVKYLVEKGANVHEVPLLLACKFGHLETVQYLVVECGADVVNDELPLVLASMNGHLEIVKFLTQYSTCAGMERAIRKSIKYRQSEITKYLKTISVTEE